MATRLVSDGTQLLYCCETTAGTRPTTGYTEISDELKSTPEHRASSDLREATTMKDAADGYATYAAPSYKKVSGAFQYKFNNTDAFQTAWGTMKSAYETAKAAGKATWFAVVVPGSANAFYYSGAPEELGLDAMEVGGLSEITAEIIPMKIHGMAAKPTAQ